MAATSRVNAVEASLAKDLPAVTPGAPCRLDCTHDAAAYGYVRGATTALRAAAPLVEAAGDLAATAAAGERRATASATAGATAETAVAAASTAAPRPSL